LPTLSERPGMHSAELLLATSGCATRSVAWSSCCRWQWLP